MIELIKNTKIDFMGKRKYAFILSGILLVIGVIALFQISRGEANLGIDFAGGTAVQVKFSKPVSVHEVRRALEGAGLREMDIQDFPAVNKVLVRVKGKQETLGNISNLIIDALTGKFADASPVIDSTTEIGPKVGSRLKHDALIAALFATFGILIYIAFRFQWRFSIGATIATFHDVLAVLGIFFVLGKEINLILVSALLIVAGYSLTDTVVVFDRIRENMRAALKDRTDVIVNRSLNEVLSRTAITSMTTLFASLALLLLGGEVIHDFALAITIGILVGTYSSWFVASPTVLLISGGKNPFKKS